MKYFFEMKLTINKKIQTFGFTLIELMIVVVIISILASIAIPAYTQYVQRGIRAEARALLMDASSKMEKHYSDCNAFGTAIAAARDCNAGNVNICGAAPCISETNRYTLAFQVATAQAYTLRATENNAGRDVDCGNFLLTSTGVKGNNIGALGGDVFSTGTPAEATAVSDCWGR